MGSWTAIVVAAYVTPRLGPGRSYTYASDNFKKTRGAQFLCNNKSTETGTSNTWYQCTNDGYWYPATHSGVQYLSITSGSNINVTNNDGSVNSISLSAEATSGNEILYANGISNTILSIPAEANELLSRAIDGSVRMFGMPHQLTPENDPRINTTSRLGRVFAETFAMDAPLIYLRPGTSNFMPDASTDDQKGLLAAIAALNGDNDRASGDLKKILNEITKDDQKYVKYFTFEEKFANYMSKVNLLCRLGSVFLKIDKVKVPWHGSGSKMTFGNYDWRGFKFKNLYTNSDLKPATRFGEDYFGNLGAFIANTLQTSIASDDTYIQFYVDAGGSFGESASNGTTQSVLNSFTDQAESIGKELAFVSGATGVEVDQLASSLGTSIDDFMNSVAKNNDSAIQNLFKRLTGVGNQLISGSNFIAPDIWSDSDYSKSYSFNITLSSPYGNTISWYLNIFVPLMHILAMTLPTQQAANAFSAPPLIRAFSPGWFSCDLGIINSISIDKGGSGDAWSASGLPTEIRVSVDIKDLYSNLALPNMYNIKDFFTNDNLISYLMVNCGLDLTNQELFTKIDVMKNLFAGSIEDKIVGGVSSRYYKFKDFIMGLNNLYK